VHGDFTVPPVRATDNPAEAGIVDLAVVCVKTPATEEAERPSELESMIGLITRQGRERGVPTPVHV